MFVHNAAAEACFEIHFSDVDYVPKLTADDALHKTQMAHHLAQDIMGKASKKNGKRKEMEGEKKETEILITENLWKPQPKAMEIGGGVKNLGVTQN